MDIGWAELLLTLLVGMGLLKAIFMFFEKTEDYEQQAGGQGAFVCVAIVVASTLTLLFLGASLDALLYFSTGALSLIWLLFSVKLFFDASNDNARKKSDPPELSFSQIGLSLVLDPVGIVSSITFSVVASDSTSFLKVARAVVIPGTVDVLAALRARRVGA